MILLSLRGRGVAFVKVVESDGNDRDAGEVHHSLDRYPPTTFFVPRVLACHRVGKLSYVAWAPLPPTPHRPARKFPMDAVCAEIRRGLSDLPRLGGEPRHWVPMHGDFTPWNFRQLTDGRFVLLDWESVAWAPPRADEVLFRCASVAVGLARTGDRLDGAAEAIQYWTEIIARRVPTDERDKALRAEMLSTLRGFPD